MHEAVEERCRELSSRADTAAPFDAEVGELDIPERRIRRTFEYKTVPCKTGVFSGNHSTTSLPA
jgi:hypothetical protein